MTLINTYKMLNVPQKNFSRNNNFIPRKNTRYTVHLQTNSALPVQV